MFKLEEEIVNNNISYLIVHNRHSGILVNQFSSYGRNRKLRYSGNTGW